MDRAINERSSHGPECPLIVDRAGAVPSDQMYDRINPSAKL
jgi:hypothetical protein